LLGGKDGKMLWDRGAYGTPALMMEGCLPALFALSPSDRLGECFAWSSSEERTTRAAQTNALLPPSLLDSRPLCHSLLGCCELSRKFSATVLSTTATPSSKQSHLDRNHEFTNNSKAIPGFSNPSTSSEVHKCLHPYNLSMLCGSCVDGRMEQL
jgi:hypothetical protein